MSKKAKLIVGLGVVLAPWLFAMPASADESLCSNSAPPPCIPKNVVLLPDSQVLRSFDISFVDAKLHTYALAASALNATGKGPASDPAVVIVDTLSNVVRELGEGASTPFAGSCSIPPARDTFSGPNGVIVIKKGSKAEVWAGDGPIFNKSCDPTSNITPGVGKARYSQVVVFDLKTGALKTTISTKGIRRADELCYNPESDVVLIANADPLDNFITFIDAGSHQVLQKISFKGGDPNAMGVVASGIEQCQFNPRDEKFYLGIPATSANGSGPGVVVRISEEAPFQVEQIFPIAASTTGCRGPSGLAVGPDHQIALGCGGTSTNSLIISDIDGTTVPGGVVVGQGGADEIWYNPGSNHYYFARSGAASLGVEDAGPPPNPDPTISTAPGSHSVAADSIQNLVYVPIRGNKATTPPGTAKVCSLITGKADDDNRGCIAIYTAPNDGDDIVAENENDQGENNQGGNSQGDNNQQ
jgi:hypothetical protein